MLCLTQIGAGIATGWLGLSLLLVCYAEPTPAEEPAPVAVSMGPNGSPRSCQ